VDVVAGVAGPRRHFRQAMQFAAALWTFCNIAKTRLEQVVQASLVIGELPKKVSNRKRFGHLAPLVQVIR
jgi:hypothetical protein